VWVKNRRFFPEAPTLARSKPKSKKPQDFKEDDVVGAKMSELTDRERETYGVAEDVSGVLIVAVKRGGLAARNGLRQGDVITMLNRVPVTSPDQVSDIISSAKKKGLKNVPILLTRSNGARFMPFRLK